MAGAIDELYEAIHEVDEKIEYDSFVKGLNTAIDSAASEIGLEKGGVERSRIIANLLRRAQRNPEEVAKVGNGDFSINPVVISLAARDIAFENRYIPGTIQYEMRQNGEKSMAQNLAEVLVSAAVANEMAKSFGKLSQEEKEVVINNMDLLDSSSVSEVINGSIESLKTNPNLTGEDIDFGTTVLKSAGRHIGQEAEARRGKIKEDDDSLEIAVNLYISILSKSKSAESQELLEKIEKMKNDGATLTEIYDFITEENKKNIKDALRVSNKESATREEVNGTMSRTAQSELALEAEGVVTAAKSLSDGKISEEEFNYIYDRYEQLENKLGERFSNEEMVAYRESIDESLFGIDILLNKCRKKGYRIEDIQEGVQIVSQFLKGKDDLTTELFRGLSSKKIAQQILKEIEESGVLKDKSDDVIGVITETAKALAGYEKVILGNDKLKNRFCSDLEGDYFQKNLEGRSESFEAYEQRFEADNNREINSTLISDKEFTARYYDVKLNRRQLGLESKKIPLEKLTMSGKEFELSPMTLINEFGEEKPIVPQKEILEPSREIDIGDIFAAQMGTTKRDDYEPEYDESFFDFQREEDTLETGPEAEDPITPGETIQENDLRPDDIEAVNELLVGPRGKKLVRNPEEMIQEEVNPMEEVAQDEPMAPDVGEAPKGPEEGIGAPEEPAEINEPETQGVEDAFETAPSENGDIGIDETIPEVEEPAEEVMQEEITQEDVGEMVQEPEETQEGPQFGETSGVEEPPAPADISDKQGQLITVTKNTRTGVMETVKQQISEHMKKLVEMVKDKLSKGKQQPKDEQTPNNIDDKDDDLTQ